MATSDAKRRANHRWDAENMAFFGVKMPKRDGIALKEACARQGVTPHSVFLAAAREYIRANAPTEPDAVRAAPSGESDGASEAGEDAATP